MVPLKLQIKNFVSYGSKTQIIDFEPYNLICLSGKNGHGKSALLDAITWVLWGRARVAGSLKPDESLIHIGQTSMMVCLDFLSKEQCYRVRREYNLGSTKNYSSLDFGVIDEKSNAYKSLTDKTIKATQEKIDKVIGLDYSSFINSAFFKQNQSNEFSKKSARERKDILANILGLDHFENIKKLAGEKLKDFNLKKDYYFQLTGQIEKDLESKSKVKSDLQKISKDLDLLISKENSYKNLLINLKKEKEDILITKSEVQKIIFEKEQLTLSIKSNTELILQEYNNWKVILRKSKKSLNIEEIDSQYNTILNELNLVQDINKKNIDIKEKLYLKNKDLEKFNLDIKNRFSLLSEDKKLKEHKYKINLENLKNRLLELENTHNQDIKSLKSLRKNLECYNIEDSIILEKKLIRIKDFYSRFENKITYITNDIKDINQKLIFIEKEDLALCPLCKQNIDGDYKQNLKNRLKENKAFLNYRLNKLININLDLDKIFKEQSDKLKNLNKISQEINIAKIKIENYIDKINSLSLEIEKYKNLIIKEEINLINISKEINLLIDQEKAAFEKDKDINLIKSQALILEKELSLNLDRLKDCSKESFLIEKLKELQEIKKEQNILLLEFSNLKEKFKNISKLIKDTKELKKSKKEKELKYNSLKYIFEKELFLQEQEKNLDIALSKVLNEKQEIMLLKGSICEQAKILDEKEVIYKENKKKLDDLNQEIEDYKVISLALSKDGIQALLIEEVIPEIESEANNLLALMTDNQAHIIIESLRDLKHGGTKETLDIKISDSLGVRPYELFSGGEAFKIDFALRIAISKLLSRRAGASLQTLIIDEGFGSQDEEGLSSIMNILYKIQNNFSKIIIVSHLTSMKDQFPVNFIVHKTPQGTLIKVFQQG